jgi:ubiquinone/menaquinone biosynthesis C-methylase UbiE
LNEDDERLTLVERRVSLSKPRALIRWTPDLYDRLSKHYDRLAAWLFPIGDRGRRKVLENISSGMLLDVACGTGTLLEKANGLGITCYGLDTSGGMLKEARKKVPGASLVQASFYALPFAPHAFDWVVETNAVSGVDINAIDVLREMVRVCAERGEVRIGDYGRSDRKGLFYRLMEFVGTLIGDYPHDYRGLFTALGHEVTVEVLGWGGVYQFIRLIR